MVYDAKKNKPVHGQRCVIYTAKGICLAIWSESFAAFITPSWLSSGVHYDILFWQPLELPDGIPNNFLERE
jgi:hypothetical protein